MFFSHQAAQTEWRFEESYLDISKSSSSLLWASRTPAFHMSWKISVNQTNERNSGQILSVFMKLKNNSQRLKASTINYLPPESFTFNTIQIVIRRNYFHQVRTDFPVLKKLKLLDNKNPDNVFEKRFQRFDSVKKFSTSYVCSLFLAH